MNRLLRVSDDGGTTHTEYDYDAIGNRKEVVYPNRMEAVYAYDALNRLSTLTNTQGENDGGGGGPLEPPGGGIIGQPGGIGTPQILSQFDYTVSSAGNRTRVEERLGDAAWSRNVDYGYDDLYRLTRETIWKKDAADEFVIARRIDYAYDKVGNRERMTVTHDDLNTNGPCVTESLTTYDYDVNDRLLSSTTTVTPLSPVAQARFNDYYGRRPQGWTRWAVLSFASVALAAFFAPLLMPYGRRLGHRARRQRIRTACVAAFFIPLMAVDPQTVDALTTEALRAQAAIAAGIPLDCDGLPTTTVTYGYDANGNQTTRTTQRDGNTTVEMFVFDVENRLVGYRKSENGSQVHAVSASYTYDADGVRTSKTTNSQTTLYTTDKNRPYAQVLEEREAKTGDLIVRYTYGDDLISQTRPQAGSAAITRYYHYDGQMSTRHLTDDSPINTSVATTDKYTYDAFGNNLGNDGTTTNAYRYTCEQFDETVGQYYLRARYYDQGVGRFASRDIFSGLGEDPRSLHKYAYAHANPVTNIDPSGRLSIVAIGVAVFAVILTVFIIGRFNKLQPAKHNYQSNLLNLDISLVVVKTRRPSNVETTTPEINIRRFSPKFEEAKKYWFRTAGIVLRWRSTRVETSPAMANIQDDNQLRSEDGRLTIYIVDSFQGESSTGGYTPGHDKAIALARGHWSGETLAHELGHALITKMYWLSFYGTHIASNPRNLMADGADGSRQGDLSTLFLSQRQVNSARQTVREWQ